MSESRCPDPGLVAGPSPVVPSIFRLTSAMLGGSARSRELAAAVIVAANDRRQRFPDETALQRWAIRTAIGLALAEPEPDVEHRTGETDHAPIEAPELLAGLDPMTRAIVVLREVDEMAFGDIASVTRLSAAQVMTRLFRARRGLQEMVCTA